MQILRYHIGLNILNIFLFHHDISIAWTVSKDGLYSGPYFLSVNLPIQSKYRKILAREKSVFGHFLRSESNFITALKLPLLYWIAYLQILTWLCSEVGQAVFLEMGM